MKQTRILYNDAKKIFTLHTENTTYQMQVDSYGFLLHLYYGRHSEGDMDYLLTYADHGCSGQAYDIGNDKTYSMDALPQEYPTRLTGDYRSPVLDVRNGDGSFGCDLRYVRHQIHEGKYSLQGLPAVYASGEEAQTLEIIMADAATQLQVTLLYGILPEQDIITRSVRILNRGEGTITLEKVQAACLDMVSGQYDLIIFYGRHAMERNYQRLPVEHGAQVIESRRGTSSHQYNPMMILADRQTTEDAGACYAMSHVYSGAFKGEVEKDQFNQTRMQLGLQDEWFSYPLLSGEEFIAPEVVMTFSADGLTRLSHNLHQCYREHLCRGKYKDQVRPVLINSWEASYFNFTGEDIYQLGVQAADLGIEMLVMDDGWFGKRNDDNSSLGDWKVNEKKLRGTLEDLVQRINGLGLKFGIWIEPEMVSEDSDLYRAHPDWVLQIPGRNPVRGRNQLLLDFSREEVVDHIYDQICRILDSCNIEYIKWDMNRSITEMHSATGSDQGKVQYDYVLGLYDFLERIGQRYPNILIEGCSGGGGRFDAGMLYYTPQIWCSDNTDAIDRIRIQYGTSFGYPIAAVGSHVSAVPNHQTGRTTPLKTRGVIAMAGTFGYELGLKKLSEEERQEIRQQIETYRRYGELIQNGLYYRLTDPTEQDAEVGAWAFISRDQSEVLFNAVMLQIHGNMTNNYVRFKGLKKGEIYQDIESKKIYPADALMEVGIPLPVELGEYHAYQMHFKIV